jgi:acetylornithine deacetylase/succinyl-diaminopimelate desuccinylase-like protein
MKITQSRIDYVLRLLSHCRPDRSKTEARFIRDYLLSIPTARADSFGNVHLDLRTLKSHRTLFVAHTDTVHHSAGFQSVYYDHAHQLVRTRGQCLGADDGAGIMVLLHLIRNAIPAYYIFTRGEERGGKGARHLAGEQYKLLEQFDRAIAFDRRGTSSVITHQSYGRTCSDTFADALSDCLCTDALMYAPDSTGVYTDTCEFIDSIPECTNISVGYQNEHGPNETLSIPHLFALMARVVEIPWDELPTARDPYALEIDSGTLWGSGSSLYGPDFWDTFPSTSKPAPIAPPQADSWTEWDTDPQTGIATPPWRKGALQ